MNKIRNRYEYSGMVEWFQHTPQSSVMGINHQHMTNSLFAPQIKNVTFFEGEGVEGGTGGMREGITFFIKFNSYLCFIVVHASRCYILILIKIRS